MKKILSIILSILMVFSFTLVGASAATITVDGLPTIPSPQEGKIYFAADSLTGATAGDTVDVPVYLVSNYNTQCKNGFVELGFRFTATGASCTVNGIKLSDEIKSFDKFREIKCFYGDPGEDYLPEGFEPVYSDFVGWGYVCFAAGLDILKQDKLKIATINLTIGEDFNDDYDVTDVNAESDFVAIELYEYNLADNFEGCWCNGPAVVVNGELTDEIFYGNYCAATPESDENYNEAYYVLAADELKMIDEIGNGQIGVSNGAIMGPVPHEKWQVKLSDWLHTTFEAIFKEIDKIRDFILIIVDAIKLF